MVERSLTSKIPGKKKENPVPQIRKADQSLSSQVERILFLQRTIGNQAVQRLMKSGALQAKLRLGAPGDICEQEADRVAEQVMRVPEPEASESDIVPDNRQSDIVQRKCPDVLESPSANQRKKMKKRNFKLKKYLARLPKSHRVWKQA